MKKRSRIPILGAAVLVMGALSVTALAASAYSTPAEAVAGLTGRTPESVTAERNQSGKTYGAIADEAGELASFREEMLEIRTAALEARVAAGTMTRDQADAILSNLEQNLAACDGTGAGGINRFSKKMGPGGGSGAGAMTRGRFGSEGGLGTCQAD